MSCFSRGIRMIENATEFFIVDWKSVVILKVKLALAD